MTIFDYLKYNDTDIGDFRELEDLPIGLFNLYWDRFSRYGTAQLTWSHKYKCYKLAEWNFFAPYESSRLFCTVLKEYDEPV